MGTGIFTEFMTEEGWSKIRDSSVYAARMAALEAARTTLGDDLRTAKLQKLFATRVITPLEMKAFLDNPAISKNSKAIVATTANSPIAKQFLHAIPGSKGLSLSPAEMRISLHLLLGIELEMNNKQCGCAALERQETVPMYHALSCKRHGGLILRHDIVKDVLADLCKSARLACDVEPRQAFSGDKQRPDLLVHFACNGQDAAYDLTIHSPLRDETSVNRTIANEQKFLETASNSKKNKYEEKCAMNGVIFIPIVLSAFGGILEESYREGIEPLIHKVKKDHFAPPNWAASDKSAYWLQRIAIALWAGNARKVSSFLKKEPIPLF